MALTRFGLQIPSFNFPGVPDARLFERVAEIATTAERSGFDSVWVMDHLNQIAPVGPPTDPIFEAYVALAGIAARTSQVRLGAMVTGVTYRNPALLAKMVTTLDVVSSGRAILGIGAGWNAEEHAAYGYDFPPLAERMERLEEAVRVCRAMFIEEAATFEGRHSRVRSAANAPRPVSPSGPPILVGGGGERRTLRIVAAHADACNLFGDVATIRRKLDVLDRHCADVGRDPGEIARTRLGTLVVAPTMERARSQADAEARRAGLDPARFRARATVGDPDSVAEQVAALFAAGLDGLVFNLADAGDLEAVELAGHTLCRAAA